MSTAQIDFPIYYEYINDADAANAAAAEKKWIAKQEARQAKNFGKVVRKLIANAGLQRLFTWL